MVAGMLAPVSFIVRVLVLLALVAGVVGADEKTSHAAAIEAWRKQRVEELTKEDGWLTLIGLHFMKTGANTVGSARDNDIVLAKAPPHVGTITVAADGKVTLATDRTSGVRVDGADVVAAELMWADARKPTLVTTGTLTFFVVDRGGKKALRVKDSAAESRTHFLGLDYFPTDPAWRIEAQWIPFEKSRLVPITTMIGQTAPEPVPGKAVFERDGRTIELLPIDEGRDVRLFFVISDLTSGKETYGGCRFLYVDWPKEGERTIVLDFNRAENPPCAFTAFSTCPLPPKENRLPFAVRAGEKSYRGGH